MQYATISCSLHYYIGVVFYYCLSQLAIFWLCHILTIFWQLKFPFASRSFKNLHRMKYIHVPCVVIGLFLPVIPVAATMIQFSLGKNSTDAVEEGLGFGMVRFPPILCAGREKNTTFHSLILPLCLILMVGISFLVYIFWIIHKASVQVLIIVFMTLSLSAIFYTATRSFQDEKICRYST